MNSGLHFYSAEKCTVTVLASKCTFLLTQFVKWKLKSLYFAHEPNSFCSNLT